MKDDILKELADDAPFLSAAKRLGADKTPVPEGAYFEALAQTVLAQTAPPRKRVSGVFMWAGRAAAVLVVGLLTWALWPPPPNPVLVAVPSMPPPQYVPTVPPVEAPLPAPMAEKTVALPDIPAPLPDGDWALEVPTMAVAGQHPHSGLTEAELEAFLNDWVEESDFETIDNQ